MVKGGCGVDGRRTLPQTVQAPVDDAAARQLGIQEFYQTDEEWGSDAVEAQGGVREGGVGVVHVSNYSCARIHGRLADRECPT